MFNPEEAETSHLIAVGNCMQLATSYAHFISLIDKLEETQLSGAAFAL